MADIDIRALSASAGSTDALADLLVEAVAAGGSVGFMHPLSIADARAFWRDALASAERGERIVFGAFAPDGRLAGATTLILACPPNQPHRAEIAKMMTAVAFRGRGIGSALIRAAEAVAQARGRWLLTLDTAAEEGAAGFYERLGYVRVGAVPDYALKPHGGLTATLLYCKHLTGGAPDL
jgi:GNAT superfamily N-acetyltransferase